MNDEPVDLAPLGLAADPVRRERLKAAIRVRTRHELARRAVRETPMATLARWFRPLLVGSGLLFAHALAVLLFAPDPPAPARLATGDAEFGVPPFVGAWLERGEEPSPLDLIVLFDGVRQ